MVFKSIGRAFKKVFRGVKKVVKKIAKPALIIGGVLLGAGLVAGQFAAFQGVTTATGFLKAAGQTMVAGGQAIAGSLGIGSGISPTLAGGKFLEAGYAGKNLFTGALAQGLGLSAGPSAEAITTTTKNIKDTTETKGLFGKLGSAFKGLGDLGQYAIIQGTLGGISGYMQSKELRRQERRADEVGGFGTPSRGEGGYTPEQIADIFSQFQLNPVSGRYTPPPMPEIAAAPTPTPPKRGEEPPRKTAQRGLLEQEDYQPQRFESSWATRANLPRDTMGIPRPLLG